VALGEMIKFRSEGGTPERGENCVGAGSFPVSFQRTRTKGRLVAKTKKSPLLVSQGRWRKNAGRGVKNLSVKDHYDQPLLKGKVVGV